MIKRKQASSILIYNQKATAIANERGNPKDNIGIFPNWVDISLRPTIVDEKIRMEDFGIDTIRGAIKNLNGLIRQ